MFKLCSLEPAMSVHSRAKRLSEWPFCMTAISSVLVNRLLTFIIG